MASPVNVIRPDGTLGSVDAEEVEQALGQGYTLASPEAVDEHFKAQDIEDKHGTMGQQAITALEGASRGLIGSTPTTWLEVASGVKPEDIAGREEANPIASGAGEAATFLAGSLAGVGEAGILSKAGKALESGLGLQKTSRLTSGVTELAKNAFEGSLYQADKEVHKKFLEDPEHPAESALANIGMTAALTGLFGGAVGAALGKGAAPKVAQEAESLVSQIERPALEAGEINAAVKHAEDIPLSYKDKVLKALKINKEKPDAGTYKKIAKELELPVPSGSTLESEYVEKTIDTLANHPHTVSGDAVRRNLESAWSGAGKVLDDVSASSGVKSVDELGTGIKSSLNEKIRARYEPIRAGYKELEQIHPLVPVEKDMVAALSKELREIKEVKLGATTDEGKLARQVLKAAENVQTAEDIGTLRNSSMLKDLSSPTNKDSLTYIKTVIKDKLEDMQEQALLKHAKSFPRNDEAGTLIKSTIDTNHALKEAYKPYIRTVSELSQWLGKGTVKGTEGALHFLENGLSATELAKKLFSAAKDPEFSKFFSKNFPEEFESVKQYQRAALRDKANIGGEFNARKFLKLFNDPKELAPEIKKSLYSPEEISKISKLETYYKNAFPRNFNPSGSGHQIAFDAAQANPKSFITANVVDAGLKGLVDKAAKSAEGKQAVALADATIKGERSATKAVKAIFSAAKEIPTNVISLGASRIKLDKLVDQAVKDPSKMVAMNDNNHTVPEYNAAFAASAARVVGYLASVKPKTEPTSPLDARRVPSSTEVAAYDRALDIAENPLTVLSGLKDANISSQDIIALRTMYPKLYNNLAGKIFNGVAQAVEKGTLIPYKTRMGLSLFLGQPMDSTMTPAGIQGAQMQFMRGQQAPNQDQTGVSKPPSQASMKGMSNIPQSYQTPEQQRQAARATGKH